MQSEIKWLKKWTIIVYAIGFAISLPLLLGYPIPIKLSFNWIKSIHILSVVVFMGNMIIGPVWGWMAMKTKNNGLIYFSIRTICLTDLYFTIPCVMLTLISGLLLAQNYGGYMNVSWIATSLVILFLSAIPAIPTLRAQYILFKLSYENRDSNIEPGKEFQRALFVSALWGTIAGILPLLSFFLMILKPVIW